MNKKIVLIAFVFYVSTAQAMAQEQEPVQIPRAQGPVVKFGPLWGKASISF